MKTIINNTKDDVSKTIEYDLFKQVVGNREIHEPHLGRLISSIERKNMLPQNPIIVNENMEVIDGQHRLLAAKALGLPIYYSIVERAQLGEIQMLNANNRAWTSDDYLKSYIARGKKEYMALQEFSDEWQFSLAISIRILCDRNNNLTNLTDFREGRFEIADRNRAERVASLVSQVRDHTPDRAFAHIKCVDALLNMSKKIDPKLLTKKLEQYQQIITRRASINDYLRQFENIINSGGEEKVSLVE